MNHVFVAPTNIALNSASLWIRHRQTGREEEKRWMEDGKQLFEVKEHTVELVDQGETCFHWSESIHRGAVKYSECLRLRGGKCQPNLTFAPACLGLIL